MQKVSSKKSFLWESENDQKKRTVTLESFVIVRWFDCDQTQKVKILVHLTKLEPQITILQLMDFA